MLIKCFLTAEVGCHLIGSYLVHLPLIGEFQALELYWRENLYEYCLVPAQTTVVRSITVHYQEVYCYMFSHQRDDKGDPPPKTWLMAIEVGGLLSYLVDEIVWERYPFLTTGEEDGQPTAFIHQKSMDFEYMNMCCDDEWVVIGVYTPSISCWENERGSSSYESVIIPFR